MRAQHNPLQLFYIDDFFNIRALVDSRYNCFQRISLEKFDVTRTFCK